MNERKENKIAYTCSIHTLEIGFRLSKITFDRLIKLLATYSKEHNYACYIPNERPSILVFDLFKHLGFTYCYTQYITDQHHSFSSYHFYMIINPRNLLNIPGYRYICITPPECINNILPYTIHLLQDLGITFINFETSIFIKRLDFCTNIKLDTAEMTKEYMRLLCKGKYIYSSCRELQYSYTGHRSVKPQNDFTITGRSFELSIYDKEHQMLSSPFSYPLEELQLATNQIRIELRVFYPKLYNLKKKYDNLSQLFDFLPELSEQHIFRYLQAIYGKGDFYQHNVAKEKIMNSHFNSTTKANMLAFMKKISKTSLQEAIEHYKTVDDFPEIYFILNKFNELNISPITLKKRSSYSMLYHPIHYIQNNNVNTDPVLK